MNRCFVTALMLVLTMDAAAEARLFGRRFVRRMDACRPAVVAQGQSAAAPRYEVRCDGSTCRRVRID